MNTSAIKFSQSVKTALTANKPVVALESTIITHGMPYPQNLDTARAVEAAVTGAGAVPATIAIIDGAVCVGLEDEQLDALAKTTGALKLSRADLAYCVAESITGSTTVAATMIVANLAGIHVFATGGIGGVHQGAESSFDISADLQELARTPVTVICAGAKAILDIPKTLEVLETNGVPVVAFGQDNIPAFWSRDSGLTAPLRIDSAEGIARFQTARNRLNIEGGMLICNPVPIDSEIPKEEMDAVIAKAVSESVEANVVGKKVTPWLLSRIVDLTDGRSLATNQALIINNAKVAAHIAICKSAVKS